MEELIVLPSALKHGVPQRSILEAWENFVAKRPRGDDCWVAVGFDYSGLEVELVGLVTANNEVLIIHALSPSTEKIKRELGLGRQR